jgi:integrase/recombinase XerD
VHVLSHGLRASEVVSLNLAAFDGQLLFLAKTKNHESWKGKHWNTPALCS